MSAEQRKPQETRTVDLTIDQITEALKAQGYIAFLWHVRDVKDVRPDLTDEQSLQVLEHCAHEHDAEIGMNWLVLKNAADDLFPKENA